MNLSRTAKNAAPTVLTVIGAIGVIATAVFAAKKAPEVKEKIEEAAEAKQEAFEQGEADQQELTTMEKVKIAVPEYKGAIIVGTLTIGCVFGSNYINRRTIKGLTGSLALSTAALGNYRKATRNIVGEEKEKEIRQEIAKKSAEENKIAEKQKAENKKRKEKLIIGGPGTDIEQGYYWFYEPCGDVWIKSTKKIVERATERVNQILAKKGQVSMYDLYIRLGAQKQKQVTENLDVGWMKNYIWDFSKVEGIDIYCRPELEQDETLWYDLEIMPIDKFSDLF